MSKPTNAIEVLEASCKYQTWEDIEPKQAKEILDYIERLENKIGELDNRRPSPWISVEREMPEKGRDVIISIKYKNRDAVMYDIAVFSDWGWITKNHPFLLDDYVKYWMPIPELSKEHK